MTERYPDDATLLAMEQDAATGVEMIPTGKSPYFLEFRKLVQRLLLATTRANDLRVYADGDLSVGVRPGRCTIGDTAIDFAGAETIALANNATTRLWLAADGSVQTSTTAMPTDRTSFLPLAEVTTEAGGIAAIADRRGEAFLAIVDLPRLGIEATADEINQALLGIGATVDAAALDTLTGGATSVADTLHRHDRLTADVDQEHALRLVNASAGGSAGLALRFDLSGVIPGTSDLVLDRDTGWLRQRLFGQSLPLLGSIDVHHTHPGGLTASITARLIAAVPLPGRVTDITLSLGANLVTDNPADQISATVKVNGAALASTDPAIAVSDGAGFRATAQGEGVAAVIKSDGTQQVARGDILTVDLTRSVSGNLTSDAADLALLVTIVPDQPA